MLDCGHITAACSHPAEKALGPPLGAFFFTGVVSATLLRMDDAPPSPQPPPLLLRLLVSSLRREPSLRSETLVLLERLEVVLGLHPMGGPL